MTYKQILVGKSNEEQKENINECKHYWIKFPAENYYHSESKKIILHFLIN